AEAMFIMEEHPDTLNIRLLSKHCFITDAILSTKRFLTRQGVSSRILNDLGLVLRELLVNALEHGNKGDTGKAIRLTVTWEERNGLKLTVEDEGQGFDHRTLLSSRGKEFSERQKRGYALIGSLAEKLEFNEEGNRVTVFVNVAKMVLETSKKPSYEYGIGHGRRFVFSI
ncbi:MAG: ATP-binding protein, partial [Candidatus Latescibacterota bacterium]